MHKTRASSAAKSTMEMGVRHQIPYGPWSDWQLLAAGREESLCKSVGPESQPERPHTHNHWAAHEGFVLFFSERTLSWGIGRSGPGKSWRRGEDDQNTFKTLREIIKRFFGCFLREAGEKAGG